MSGLLCAESAKSELKKLQAAERERLGLAGRKKLEEYRQLKAALLQGDLHTALAQSNSFSSSSTHGGMMLHNPLHVLPNQQGARQQQQNTDDVDPMIDLLLAQVSALMSDKQRLTAQCSNLQRANEQLSELVGFLSVDHLSLTECDGQEPTPGSSSSSCSSSSTEGEPDMWLMQQEEAHSAHFQQKAPAQRSETL